MARFVPPPPHARPPVTLELTAKEADFLFGVLQNPLGCAPCDEPAEDFEARRAIWDALLVARRNV